MSKNHFFSFFIIHPSSHFTHNSCLNLCLKDILKSHSISSKLADTLPQLLNCHLVLVEVEAEIGFVVDVCLFLEVKGTGFRSVELLGNGVAGAHELFEEIGLVLSVWGPEVVRETYGNGQVIATGQLCDLTNASERGTHDDGLISELLVVVEDGLDGCNSWVFLFGICLSGLGLVPIEDTSDEGGDEESSGLGGGDGLDLREHEGEVDIDAVVTLEDAGGLDALPC
jgi:hypothetical protein